MLHSIEMTTRKSSQAASMRWVTVAEMRMLKSGLLARLVMLVVSEVVVAA